MPGGDEDPRGCEARVCREGPSHIGCRSLEDRAIRHLSATDHGNTFSHVSISSALRYFQLNVINTWQLDNTCVTVETLKSE